MMTDSMDLAEKRRQINHVLSEARALIERQQALERALAEMPEE